MTQTHPITPPPPHLLKKFSAQAQAETKKRNGAGYLKTFATLCIEWALNSQPTPNDRQIRSSEITPPPEMVAQWLGARSMPVDQWVTDVATQAAQWGGDQELEACCAWLAQSASEPYINALRIARRKPPSLNSVALQMLGTIERDAHYIPEITDTIRRALLAQPVAEGGDCPGCEGTPVASNSPCAVCGRIALNQPEPVAPTDQEIEEWADACPEAPLEEMDPEVHGWRRCFTAKEFGKTIRAALARWGHPTPQPVAVSERLPRPEDCLDEGWAWFFNQRIGWRQAVLPVIPGYTHWLPANALPTPEATNG